MTDGVPISRELEVEVVVVAGSPEMISVDGGVEGAIDDEGELGGSGVGRPADEFLADGGPPAEQLNLHIHDAPGAPGERGHGYARAGGGGAPDMATVPIGQKERRGVQTGDQDGAEGRDVPHQQRGQCLVYRLQCPIAPILRRRHIRCLLGLLLLWRCLWLLVRLGTRTQLIR